MKQFKFLQKLKQFQDDKKGNIAIIFGMTLVPVLALIGGAIDFKRAFNAKADLRTCMETAALAVPGMGLGANVSDSDINGAVQSILSAQPMCAKYLDHSKFGVHAVFTGKIIRDGGPRSGRINVTAQATIDTYFLGTLHNLNILSGKRWGANLNRINLSSANNPLEIDVASNTKVEIALVLDTTGSMRDWLGGKKKINSLKDSVSDLVTSMRSNDPDCAPLANQPNSRKDAACKHVKMGMVPFANYINIGTPKQSEGLFKATDTHTTPEDTVPTWLNTSNFPATTTGGSITADPQHSWIQPYIDGWMNRYSIPTITNYLNYLGITYSETGGTTTTNLNNWEGCVVPRSGNLYTDNSLAFDGDDASKIKAVSDYCSTKPVQRLTRKIYDIKKAVDKLSASGGTNTAIGLEWGFRLLSKGIDQGIDFDETGSGNEEVQAYDDKEWMKVMILMTDGTNSSSSYNGLSETLCQNIKDAGIKIFSIAFLPTSAEEGDTAYDLMQTCASKGSYFFHATSSIGLSTSFSTIAKEISALRIAR